MMLRKAASERDLYRMCTKTFTWRLLTGPEAGQVREGSLVFQIALVGDLKKIFDNPATPFMVGVLGKGEARNGNSAPYLFGMPSDEQVTLARQAAAHFGWI